MDGWDALSDAAENDKGRNLMNGAAHCMEKRQETGQSGLHLRI